MFNHAQTLENSPIHFLQLPEIALLFVQMIFLFLVQIISEKYSLIVLRINSSHSLSIFDATEAEPDRGINGYKWEMHAKERKNKIYLFPHLTNGGIALICGIKKPTRGKKMIII
jgi:hypothetical protein